MKIGYAWVSSNGQSLDSQEDALKRVGCEKVYFEKESGGKDDRPVLNEVLNFLREGDTLVVYKLDRLGRSTRKLLELIEDLKERGVDFISLSDSIDTTTPQGRFFFTVMAAFAEMERDLIRERTKAGLKAARARGRKGGRPQKAKKDVDKAVKLYNTGEYTVPEIEKMTGVSKPTLYRYLKKQKES